MMKIQHPYNMKDRKEYARRSDDYKELYKTDLGKRVLDDILYYAAIDRTAFSNRGNEQTYFNLGKQSVGYHIMNNLSDQLFTQQTTTTEEEYD